MRGFMGLQWDGSVPSVEVFAEMFRVLKDGGRLLCFAGTRTFHRMWCNIEDAGFTIEDTVAWMYGSGFPKHKSKLKPAYEPICVARKGGTSELNIDECRITTTDNLSGGAYGQGRKTFSPSLNPSGLGRPGAVPAYEFSQPEGRWPANVAFDEDAAAMLDAQTGTLTSGANNIKKATGAGYRPNALGTENRARGTPMIAYGDSGGASRFFYCAKAARSEREAGLEDAPRRNGGSNAKGFTDDVAAGLDRNRPVGNHHPTVKPVDLMRWLVRLITPPGGTVLDPFCGSGTAGIASVLEQRNFIGIDISAEYLEIAQRRIQHWSKK